jgi:hypothetical protein
MNTAEIRQQINTNLDRLSFEGLNLVAEFVEYVADKESQEATKELLNIPGFLESFERAKKDIAASRVTNWRSVRSDI